jgi:TonB family protein
MLNLLRRCALVAGVCTAASPLVAQEPAPAPDGVYDLAQVEVRPRALNAAELAGALEASYPPHLRDAGVHGKVVVAMIVGTDGQPRDLELVSTSDTAFAAPTLAMASLLRFSPAQVSGRDVRVRLSLPINWMPAPRADTPGPDSTGAFELSEVTDTPRLLNQDALVGAMTRSYPPELRRNGVTASVQVRFRVGEDGRVSTAYVTSSTDARFDAGAVEVARVLRFSPARLDGQPVAVWVDLPLHWNQGERLPPRGSSRPRVPGGPRPATSEDTR